jgi:hypothetical protein
MFGLANVTQGPGVHLVDFTAAGGPASIGHAHSRTHRTIKPLATQRTSDVLAVEVG